MDMKQNLSNANALSYLNSNFKIYEKYINDAKIKTSKEIEDIER